jgi:hypothetical protein
MPKPFHQITLDQFAELLEKFPFTRAIESVHMHHTWRPNCSQYRGLSTIENMWTLHTQTNGWSDIAHHISIAPDGSIWTGRNWNQPPASASGFNGNRTAGPFMFEIIGDFDTGKDPFDGPQKHTVLSVIALVQKHFKLKPDTLRFHNSMSDKTCPGSAVDYKTTLKEVGEIRAKIDAQAAPRAGTRNFPFNDSARAIFQVIDTLRTAVAATAADVDAEGCLHDHTAEAAFARSTVPGPAGPGARGVSELLTPEVLQQLQPHVINLNLGRLSAEGVFKTREADVDAIFEDHLPAWAAQREGKIPIVFYAHGGLTSEESGLLTAVEQVEWWKANGAYPIHFVWETGLVETLGQLIAPGRQRGIDFAAPSDFLIETAARTLGGVKIWSGMKVSAERASDANGGARYAARKLKAFCDAHKDRVELHAVGHSAGSIFHAYFVPAALDEGAPNFRSLHFLAPAIRVDTFEQQLLKKIGKDKGVDHLSVFTMARAFEEADNCFSVYRKSLLYLIYYGLEPDRKTPILGLEESIRDNAKLKRLFDLDRKGKAAGEVIWSVSKDTTGRSATTSRTHGGFNNDAPTMQSVAQRILDKEVTPFTGTEERGLSLVDSLSHLDPALAEYVRPSLTFPQAPTILPPTAAAPSAGGGGRRALCVGIDRYPTAPLGGCANDARAWRETFRALGFEVPTLLLDEQATRSAIMHELSELIRSSRAGDVLAFQFAGHGTQLPDLDGDEARGDSPGLDEALCPVDFDRGYFVIDDDLAAVFNTIPDGVSVTVFTDCCHSGTITRFAIGTPPAARTGGTVKKRFVTATPEMKAAHAAFRASLGGSRALTSRGVYDQAREVLFCACRSQEVALESDGHGHFTTQATRVLAAGIGGLTNADFQTRVISAFGPNPSQNPELHCAPHLRGGLLLAPLSLPAGGRAIASQPGSTGGSREDVARLLEDAARLVRG